MNMSRLDASDNNGHSNSNLSEEEAAIRSICDELIDEVIIGTSFQVHRAIKMGTFFLDEMDEIRNEKDYEIVDEIGLDVFGQVPMKKQLECVCPNCQRNLAASRFAPHLEKCMGMGRSSSRIANRRIANSGKDAGSDDDENDDDWTYNSDRKGSKKKREKTNNSPRRSKLSKIKNGEVTSVNSNLSDGGGSFPNYETMSMDERKGLLIQMCGVISEHTKKMCTRSHRCPQHSDEQRKSVRVSLLGQQGAILDLPDDIHVDIDTYDDLDGQNLRDSIGHLWDAGPSTNPSPTDSTSTNNSSTSSRKKERKSKGNPNRNKKSTSISQSNNKIKGSSAPSSQTANSASIVAYEVT